MPGIHHTAIVTADVEASMRFWRDGLGFTELFDHTFTGDWPTLFGVATDQLRSIFLGDPDTPDTGIVELVMFARGREEQEVISTRPAPTTPDVPALGFFLLPLQRDVDATLATLARLGFDAGVRRIEMPAPGGKKVAMAVLTAPDGVRVELIGPPESPPSSPAAGPGSAVRWWTGCARPEPTWWCGTSKAAISIATSAIPTRCRPRSTRRSPNTGHPAA